MKKRGFRFTVLAALTVTLTACGVSADDGRRPHDADVLVVGNKGENSVSFINLASGKEIARKPSGKMPHEVAISPDGRQVAVVSYGGSSIDIYDAISFKRTQIIDISPNSRPHGLLWLSNDRMIATTEGSKTLTVISAPDASGKRTVQGIKTGAEGHMVAVTPDHGFAYTADLNAGTVTMIDLKQAKRIRTVAAGPGAEGIAVSADGKEVWVSARETNKVYIYDAATLNKRAEIDVGKFPLRIIASPDGKYMVTSNLIDGSLSVINIAARKVERTIEVTGNADSRQVTVLFSADGSRIYAALTGVDKIAEIDFANGKLLRMLAGGEDGDGLAIVAAP